MSVAIANASEQVICALHSVSVGIVATHREQHTKIVRSNTLERFRVIAKKVNVIRNIVNALLLAKPVLPNATA